jgi:hypothetical protein
VPVLTAAEIGRNVRGTVSSRRCQLPDEVKNGVALSAALARTSGSTTAADDLGGEVGAGAMLVKTAATLNKPR